MMTARKALQLLALVAMTAACTTAEARPPPTPVDEVDLPRYMGVWYEIARIPNRFQDHCARNSRAEYSLRDDGQIDVTNRCVTREGKTDAVHGIARRTSQDGSNARLEVSFFDILGWRPVWGDYWIIGLDRGYDWVIVGHPDREYGWILSRAPRLTDTARERVDQLLRAQGYEPTAFSETPQVF